MFCGKCGKEIADTAKFCPYCGSENPNMVKNGPAPVRMLGPASGSPELPWMVSAICGALHVLFFFALSFGRLGNMGNAMANTVSYFGLEIPRRLTPKNGIQVWGNLADVGITNAAENHTVMLILFLIPVVLGILLVVNCFWKKNTVLSIVFPAIISMSYLLIRAALPTYEQLGYEIGAGWIFALLVAVIGAAVPAWGHVSGKNSGR
jgi:hypothetical protein